MVKQRGNIFEFKLIEIIKSENITQKKISGKNKSVYVINIQNSYFTAFLKDISYFLETVRFNV